MVRVLGKPVALAVGADRLFTDLALERILQNIVADTAYEFR